MQGLLPCKNLFSCRNECWYVPNSLTAAPVGPITLKIDTSLCFFHEKGFHDFHFATQCINFYTIQLINHQESLFTYLFENGEYFCSILLVEQLTLLLGSARKT